MQNVIIIGSGVAGLAASHKLLELGINSNIYESSLKAGGLLGRIVIGGFTFDQAVHLSFATEADVRATFDKAPFDSHRPESYCHDNGFWLKHPAQNNMFPIGSEDKIELIAGLVEEGSKEIENYEDWLIQQYGRPMAERWPLVYTKKYWTVDAARLGTDWVGKRMRKSDLREILAGAFNSETPNHYYVSEMRYPKNGGYQSFIDPLIDRGNITFDSKLLHLDLSSKYCTFSSGKLSYFDELISTMPLPDLIKTVKDVPKSIASAAASLFATSVDLISVGFSRPNVSPSLWFYIYDNDIFAARAYSPDRKSLSNVPPGCSALQFEIYTSRESARSFTVEEMKDNTIYALEKMKLALREDILFMEHTHVRYANVVFDKGMEDRRDLVRDWLERKGVTLAGRFGTWEYLWSNQAFMSGIQAAEKVKKKSV